jgi:hypothetical protein
MAGFREAYARLRQFHIRDCRKHGLADDAEQWADEKIGEMSIIELLNELEMWAGIIDDENVEAA